MNETDSFELYVLKQDLTVNPIPERADQLRDQAIIEGGLCTIDIPAYTDVNGFLGDIVLSVTGADCDVQVCRSGECDVCTREIIGDPICTPCASSGACDGLEDVVEFRYCDCDLVVTVDENNEFAMYTGKMESALVLILPHSSHILCITLSLFQYPTRPMSHQMTLN